MSGYNINQDVIISGTLTVKGPNSTIRSMNIKTFDNNLELGAVDTPTDSTATGGGLTVKGTTDKTIIWDSAQWSFSDSINIPSGKSFKIGGTTILSENTNIDGRAKRFFFAQL